MAGTGLKSFSLNVPNAAAQIADLAVTGGITGVQSTYREVTIQNSLYQADGATASTANIWVGDATLGTVVGGVKQKGVILTPGQSKLYRGVAASVFLGNLNVMRDPNTAGAPVVDIDCQSY